MNPRDEALSLKKEPLPPVVLEDVRLLPTQIHQLDDIMQELQDEIAKLSERIANYRQIRKEKLELAIKEGILDDGAYMIERKITPAKRVVDAVAFRLCYPAEYMRLLMMRVDESRDTAEKMRNEILLKEADLLDDGTYILKPSVAPTQSFSQVDLKIVIKGKGAPEKLEALLRPGGDPTVSYTVKKAGVLPCEK